MLPIGDDNTGRRITPVVTYILIALNVVFFLVEMSGGEAFIQRWAFVPRRFLADPAGDFATLFTAMFMHAGWLHLLGNMLYLWIFGDNVEDRFGHAKFVVFYLVCGIAAALGQVAADPHSTLPTIGASGAIAGVMGAYFVLYPRSRVLTLIPLIFIQVVELPATILLGFWFLMQLFSAGTIAVTASSHGSGGVAFAAHVAGFIVGAIGVFVFRKPDVDRWNNARYY